jgi:carboxymethylenebutenolidase
MTQVNKQVQELLDAHNRGQLSRRDFIVKAGLLLSGAVVGGTILAGSPSPSQASSPAQATAESTSEALATLAATADPSIKLVTKMVEFDANGSKAPGYLAYPEGDGEFPGVVIIQEWWGLDDHIKAVTELMARFGFAALAPDLYHGEVAKEPNEAQKLAMALVMDQAIKDVQGAADYLAQQTFVGPKKVGVMGFCMGGGIAFRMSWAGNEHIGAVASFYGNIDPSEEVNFPNIKVPVLALVGSEDRISQKIPGWEQTIRGLGKTYESHVYPGARHAFFNDTRPQSYNAGAAEDALQRTLDWFSKYLTTDAEGASPTTEATQE